MSPAAAAATPDPAPNASGSVPEAPGSVSETSGSVPDASGTARRGGAAVFRGATLGLLALGAGVGSVAAAQPWWRASGGATDLGLSGNEVSSGLTQGLALVAAAALLLCLVLRVTGRRVLGALVTLVGVGMTVAAGYRFRPGDETVLGRLREIGLVDEVSVAATVWPLPYGIGGVLVGLAGITLVARAHRWPVRPDRFDRTSESPAPSGGADGPLTDPLLAWRALDAGQDPTLGRAPDERDTVQADRRDGTATGARDTPDVQSGGPGDTMGTTYDTPGPHDPAERRTT